MPYAGLVNAGLWMPGVRIVSAGGEMMSDRIYRLLVGSLILIGLYYDLHGLMVGLIAVMLFEGLTPWRMPVLVAKYNHVQLPACSQRVLWGGNSAFNIPFHAERAWRLVVAMMLTVTYLLFYDAVWFFPWFMGFAIFGAGLSGICPVLIFLQLLGFK